MTQLDVVHRLREMGRSTSLSTYARWEATGSVRLDEGAMLARMFGVTLDELVRGPAPQDAEDAVRDMESASARAAPPRSDGSRRARRGDTQRGA